ncbi:MAG TPA: relaxase/mobilization nuclease domain-containing protein [Mucilaginibacter sp.]
MIVKFLYTAGPNGHFPAVDYNSDKMDKNKGDLVKTENFGFLQGMGQWQREDYRNYLKMVSANNKAVKKPQFHVAISAPERSYNKEQLAEIATQWMERMGYGKQPYLLIFHKDTDNNHIHIVSTRVDKQGKKIKDSFEQIRGHEQMNIILGLDEKQNASVDAEKALTYRFSTKAQYLMIVESMGYAHKEEDGNLKLIKFGKRQGQIDLKLVEDRLQNKPDEDRRRQLTAWFHKYAGSHDTSLHSHHGKYQSAFSAYLKTAMGIELVFHASGDKPPYGYTVLDHAKRNVFKGGEIMPLKELLAIEIKPDAHTEAKESSEVFNDPVADDKQRQYYAAILKAVLYNYTDMLQGLHHQGLTISRTGEDFYLGDPGAGVYVDTADLLDEKAHRYLVEQFCQHTEIGQEINRQHIHIPALSLASDIDDEAINGRNRRRKQKARTNQR